MSAEVGRNGLQTREQIQKTVTGLWREMFGEIQDEQKEWLEYLKKRYIVEL